VRDGDQGALGVDQGDPHVGAVQRGGRQVRGVGQQAAVHHGFGALVQLGVQVGEQRGAHHPERGGRDPRGGQPDHDRGQQRHPHPQRDLFGRAGPQLDASQSHASILGPGAVPG